MARNKVKLMWIVQDAARKASLRKRRDSLFKKVSELTILCGVDGFIIIYSPDDSEPAVWPSPLMVQQILTRFQNIPDIERYKKMEDPGSYMKEITAKAQEKIKKLQRKNMVSEISYLISQLHHGNKVDNFEVSELQRLSWLVWDKLKQIRRRVEYFEQVPPLSPSHFLPQTLIIDQIKCGTSNRDGRNNSIDANPSSWDQWFINTTNNNGKNIVGSSSSSTTKIDMVLPNPYNIIGSSASGAGLEVHHGNIGGQNCCLGLNHSNMGGSSNRNQFGPILAYGNIGRDCSLISLPYKNIGGNTTGGNASQGLIGNTFWEFGQPYYGDGRDSNTSTSNMGLPNFDGSSIDM